MSPSSNPHTEANRRVLCKLLAVDPRPTAMIAEELATTRQSVNRWRRDGLPAWRIPAVCIVLGVSMREWNEEVGREMP